MIQLSSCPKGCSQDLDKAVPAAETVRMARGRLQSLKLDLLAETRRVDTGRLGIPVFLSVCGHDARTVMPTRKQMGKGASASQAEASALMELVERYSYFRFMQQTETVFSGTWSEAEEHFQGQIMPVEQLLLSVGDTSDAAAVRPLLDLVRWQFCPATQISSGQRIALPLDWFRTLNEFNGSSAGNTYEEAVLQGLCELVERHVCCIAARDRQPQPTIMPQSTDDAVLLGLLDKFTANGIEVLLKDFSMGLPAPTVAALAYDPSTLGTRSEIVFTAGTAATPAKAAIRALTEVAQLAGDFETGSCYEASGLPKYTSEAETGWLKAGPQVAFSDLPHIGDNDIFAELTHLTAKLGMDGFHAYCIDTTAPELDIPAVYTIVPGFRFRERDKNASPGLFIGRILSEQYPPEAAADGLEQIRKVYGDLPCLPFYQGIIALRQQQYRQAASCFAQAQPVQPEKDSQAMAAFYHGYSLTLADAWAEALPLLDRAVSLCPQMKEYINLRGVARYRLQQYEAAAHDFRHLLQTLDRESAVDHVNLGLCHEKTGNTAAALQCYRDALAIDPALQRARQRLQALESAVLSASA
jgi:ribosomal protein S12 methylthiotransferase accessory factor